MSEAPYSPKMADLVMRSLGWGASAEAGEREYKEQLSGFTPRRNSLAGQIKEALALPYPEKWPTEVYFVQIGEDVVKIGCSKQTAMRERALSRYGRLETVLLGAAPGGYASEHAIHAILEHLRIEGEKERFRLTPDLADAIREACNA
jgi:hypothetical protein